MNEQGSILITAVWVISIFSVMTTSLAFHAGQEVFLMKRELSGLQGRMDFTSGLNETVRMIQEDPSPHEDSKDKPWLGDWKPEGTLGARLSIHVEDEESKLNLNNASAAFLSAFLKEYETEFGSLKGDRKAYVQAILKLRYEKRIESLEELLFLDDFKKEDLVPLKKYLTVYPDSPFLNPNTASPLMLRALVRSLSADHASKQMLIGRLEEACQDHGCFFSSKELAPEVFAEKLKLPKTPLLLQAVQEFVTALTTDSETFLIAMTSTEGPEASGVFHCRVGQTRPEVYGWHENI